MSDIANEVRKTLLQHITGPRGGLFALGGLSGAACMYFFMAHTQIAEMERHYNSQVSLLQGRVEVLEKENGRIHERLEEIALKRID
ncbi:MAG: hypothetical protein COA43_11250 [Robiginitomaculum sp.]|nr:MAG: hypothetical protein COA43_11250 [Robiginitomaculum sp.]